MLKAAVFNGATVATARQALRVGQARPHLQLEHAEIDTANQDLYELEIGILGSERVGNEHEVVVVVNQVIVTILKQDFVSLDLVLQVLEVAPLDDELLKVTDAAQVRMIVLLLVEGHLLKVLEYVLEIRLLEFGGGSGLAEGIGDRIYLVIQHLDAS